MTWFDVAALVVVALAVTDGIVSGLVWAVLELVLLVLAGLVTSALRPLAEPYVHKIADLSQPDLSWATHIAVFAMVACMLLGGLFLLHPTSKKWRFKHDRWIGGIFGIANGLLAAMLLFAMAVWGSARPYEDQLRESWIKGPTATVYGGGMSPLFHADLGLRLTVLESR